jgi:peptidoglycan/LPS O-acetylase OafA/YrhL
MIDVKRLRRTSAKIANGLVLMIFGAWLLLQYLDSRDPGISPSLRRIDDVLFYAFLICMIAATHLPPREDRPVRGLREPSPRWSGTYVVLATGGAATAMAATSGSDDGYWTAAAIAFGTVAAAILVWRFATKHAGEIGEARFSE